MAKIFFLLLSILFVFGCNRSDKSVINEFEMSGSSDKELKVLMNAKKSELFKIVETGKLKRDLMRQTLDNEEFAKKKQELLVFIENAPKLYKGFILESGPVILTKKQIEKFRKIYFDNLNRNAAKPLMGNIGCGFNADYCLSFYHKEDRVDFIFCFSCNLYKVLINSAQPQEIKLFLYVEEELKEFVFHLMSKNK